MYDHKRRQHAECSFCLRVLSQTGHQYLETPKQRHSHHIMYPDLLNPRSLMRSNVTSTCIRWKTVTELSATFRKRFLEWNVLKTLVYSSRVDGRKLNFLKMMTSPCLTLTMFHCYFPPEHFFFFSGSIFTLVISKYDLFSRAFNYHCSRKSERLTTKQISSTLKDTG